MGRLDGKVAIVTGGGTGIGQAIAALYSREGAKVVVAGRRIEPLEKTVKMIKDTHGVASFVQTDISRANEVQELVGKTVSNYGKLDILVNNAAIGSNAYIVDATEKSFYDVIDTNLKGTWLCMKYAIPEMLKANGGSIINFSSSAAFLVHPTFGIYAASKGAVVSLTKVAAVEYGPKNIKVNAIAPSATATQLLLDCWSEKTIRLLEKGTPDGRIGKSEEVANLALYLASDESSHITGQTIHIDGGFTIYKRID